MNARQEANIRTATAYNAAADFFDHPANTFWERFGQTTIDRIGLQSGDNVLDVCSGAGSSAIPAAEKVGPDGHVLAVDLAENLLQLASAKARRKGLEHTTFRVGDMLSLGLDDESFDAVICIFGIFFVPDMPGAVRELWRMVRPGGKLAITTWGPNFFEPANSVFWNAIWEEAPHLYKSFNPWDRISTPDSLRGMLREAGVEVQDITSETATHPITSPEDWWATLLGTGYRGTIDQLDAAARERVQAVNMRYIDEARLDAVEANVIYSVAQKPS